MRPDDVPEEILNRFKAAGYAAMMTPGATGDLSDRYLAGGLAAVLPALPSSHPGTYPEEDAEEDADLVARVREMLKAQEALLKGAPRNYSPHPDLLAALHYAADRVRDELGEPYS